MDDGAGADTGEAPRAPVPLELRDPKPEDDDPDVGNPGTLRVTPGSSQEGPTPSAPGGPETGRAAGGEATSGQPPEATPPEGTLPAQAGALTSAQPTASASRALMPETPRREASTGPSPIRPGFQQTAFPARPGRRRVAHGGRSRSLATRSGPRRRSSLLAGRPCRSHPPATQPDARPPIPRHTGAAPASSSAETGRGVRRPNPDRRTRRLPGSPDPRATGGDHGRRARAGRGRGAGAAPTAGYDSRQCLCGRPGAAPRSPLRAPLPAGALRRPRRASGRSASRFASSPPRTRGRAPAPRPLPPGERGEPSPEPGLGDERRPPRRRDRSGVFERPRWRRDGDVFPQPAGLPALKLGHALPRRGAPRGREPLAAGRERPRRRVGSGRLAPQAAAAVAAAAVATSRRSTTR